MLLVAHYVGCGFHFVGVYEEGDSWLKRFGFSEQSIVDQYVASIYWAIITMNTIGYGDITAITTMERLYVIVMTIISGGIFAFVINQSNGRTREHRESYLSGE